MQTFLRRLVASQLEQRVQQLIRKNKLKIVAVTGSVGKTSTKLAIASVLSQKYRVLAHQGNYNSELGMPLSIFELEVPASLKNPMAWFKILNLIDQKLKQPYPYDVLVLEMGADQPNDIQKFMRYIEPDIGIVTAIAPAHLEQFGSVDAIAHEKMALARGSRVVLLNAEDPRVMEESKKLGREVSTYGVRDGNAHFEGITRLKNLTLNGRLQLADDEVAVKTNFVAEHSLSALAAAAAVGEELGLNGNEIKAGIQTFESVSGRMQVFNGVNGSTIIDDTYNSSPRAATAAVAELLRLPTEGRRIAVLGTMNELGDAATEAHRELGRVAAKVDLLVTIGKLAGDYITAGAVEAGIDDAKIKNFMSPYKAGEFLKSELNQGDLVLAKGSQNGVFAEEAVALILADPKDRKRLVRQSESWERKKQEQFKVQ
ncbi:hypothetical protein EPO04_00050 [Patescibacteria group bacterium]|nr:MAG: hypothetical protein EPO04_00050 [Patescibacteria group bacterium]